MKTTVLFALGFIIAGAAIIMPFTEASRTAYHQYITSSDQSFNYRRFSNPVGNRDRIMKNNRYQYTTRNTSSSQFVNSNFRPRHYRASYINRQPSTVSQSQNQPKLISVNRPTRTFSEGRTASRVYNGQQRQRTNYVRPVNYRGSHSRNQFQAPVRIVVPNPNPIQRSY